MHIDTIGLRESVGYTKTAANFLVEYGFVTPDQGEELVSSVHLIQKILKTLPAEIQTNGMDRVRTVEEMIEWMRKVDW